MIHTENVLKINQEVTVLASARNNSKASLIEVGRKFTLFSNLLWEKPIFEDIETKDKVAIPLSILLNSDRFYFSNDCSEVKTALLVNKTCNVKRFSDSKKSITLLAGTILTGCSVHNNGSSTKHYLFTSNTGSKYVISAGICTAISDIENMNASESLTFIPKVNSKLPTVSKVVDKDEDNSKIKEDEAEVVSTSKVKAMVEVSYTVLGFTFTNKEDAETAVKLANSLLK